MLLTGGIVAVTASVGLVAGVAGPASADPTTTYVAVGSDTTMDVMNGIARGIGLGFIGSWDAVNPVTLATHDVINPKPGCNFARPNGSTEGIDALRTSLGGGPGSAPLPLPQAGCVDIARSSSGPTNDPAGQLVYIPFALDAVAPATGPATAVGGSDPSVATAITHADEFTVANLTTLYHDCLPVTVGGVTYTPDSNIHLYIPQSGSGTRKFWAKTLGNFDAVNPPSCVHDTIVGSSPPVQVEEHDGTVFATDPLAIGPFSIANWIAQSHASTTFVRDRRHNAVLHSLVVSGSPVSPFVTGGNMNASYPITREVFNVVKYASVVGASADANLVALLVGTSSALCNQGVVIRRFGYATLNGTTSAHTCGATSNDLRAFATL